VGLRGKRGVNGDQSGEGASVRQPHGVDEQISMLLESLDVELSETGLSRPASRPPNSKRLRPVRSFTSNRRSRRSIASPPASARARRRALVKGRGLDPPRAHTRIRRRLVGDLGTREDVFLIIAVLLGIGVGLAILLLLG